MANYCSNLLTVTGSKDAITSFVSCLTYDNENTPQLVASYCFDQVKLAFDEMHGVPSRIRRSDIETKIISQNEEAVVFSFLIVMGPPHDYIDIMAQEWPQLSFRLQYEMYDIDLFGEDHWREGRYIEEQAKNLL